MNTRQWTLALAALAAAALASAPALADGSGDPAVAKTEDGKNFDKDGNPTFKVAKDGTVDWYTYSGFRRYHSECHVCHGPDGEGSSYAPALANSLKTLSYTDFMTVVSMGRKDVDTANNKVMPSFGTNKNVMCYADDLYIYLRARADDKVGRGRPPKHEAKPEAFTKNENACMGGGDTTSGGSKPNEAAEPAKKGAAPAKPPGKT